MSLMRLKQRFSAERSGEIRELFFFHERVDGAIRQSGFAVISMQALKEVAPGELTAAEFRHGRDNHGALLIRFVLHATNSF